MNEMKAGSVYGLWDAGQRHLAAGRYVTAGMYLERAMRGAWRERDGATLARVWLPLLEARRQVRQNAADGAIWILGEADGERMGKRVKAFLGSVEAGTIFVYARDLEAGRKVVERVRLERGRTGRCLEGLVLMGRSGKLRVYSEGSGRTGLGVRAARDERDFVGESTERDLVLPLPGAGVYGPGEKMYAVARESIITGWEGLALKWQGGHGMDVKSGAWGEVAWLMRGMEVDPACEPVAMRLMRVAEGVGRRGAR